MKKIIVALAAASLLFASCNGDTCECKYKQSNGDQTTVKQPKPEDGSCSDVAKQIEDKLNAAGTLIGADSKIKVSCTTIQSEIVQ